jgi:endoglucanase
MRFFRPHLKFPKFKTKRQFAKSAGVAALLTLIVAVTGVINFNSQAANLTSPNWDPNANTWITSGDWHNCDGTIDNDSAHHSTNMSDTDSAHHLGMVCKGKKEAWSPQTPIPDGVTQEVKAAFAEKEIVAVQPAIVTPDVLPQIESKKIVITPSSNSGNPFAGAKLFVNPYNEPATYVRNNNGNYNAQLMDKIAKQPEVEWLGGWNWNIKSDVSRMLTDHSNQGALPVFVVYNIPSRDCGGYSSGGVTDANSYRNWISQIATTIGNKKAVVILEPDALTLTDCLNDWQKSERFQMMRDAVSTFKSQGNISVYLDAGHPNWLSASDMASRLKSAGVDSADGFALNIANFYTNDQNASYGKQVSDKLGGKHFVVDTGRNGSGTTPDSQWCNPSGRSLGAPPTTNTGNSLIDAYLWVKGPGGSDGYCNGGPSAGTFWPDYALGLAQRTNW